MKQRNHMNNSKEARFLIDKIDAKLGRVEKELKFDKISFAVGIGIAILCVILMFIFADSHPVLSLFLGLIVVFGLCIAYTMAKEFLDDLKRFNAQSKE